MSGRESVIKLLVVSHCRGIERVDTLIGKYDRCELTGKFDARVGLSDSHILHVLLLESY